MALLAIQRRMLRAKGEEGVVILSTEGCILAYFSKACSCRRYLRVIAAMRSLTSLLSLSWSRCWCHCCHC